MDRVFNSKLDKDTIYEIYRGCRLCGAGAGYKMPIVQNVVDLEESGAKLCQKIRECVQIKVHQGDKMPPLICELCVDKVNDFYEFLVMCRQTNRQTRLKLGLPLQTTSSGPKFEFNNGCILGMSETIYVDDDSDAEPLSKHTNKSRIKERHKEGSPRREQSSRNMKEVKLESKDTLSPGRVTRTSSSNIRQDKLPLPQKNSPAPVRVTRTSSIIIKRERTSSTEDVPIPARVTRTSNHLQQQQVKNTPPLQTLNKSKTGGKPKSILKKENDNGVIKIEDKTAFFENRKRAMANEAKSAVPSKKVRISSDSPKPSSKVASQKTKSLPTEQSQRSLSRTSSQNSHQRPQKTKTNQKRSSTPLQESVTSQKSDHSSEVTCAICQQVIKTSQGYQSHVRVHVVSYTNNKFACNPCGEWFLNPNEVQAHQRLHKFEGLPYSCRRCSAEFKEMNQYNNHFTNGECIPYDVVPDVKCEICWRYFATDNLLIQHKCAGEAGRPGGKCSKCNRFYVLMKNLKTHEGVCKHKNKNKPIVKPGVMEDLKPVQIRLVRCDSLLTEKNRESLYAWSGTQNYGLDENCVYPYISSVRSLKIKSEPFDDDLDYMVDINDKVKEFLTEEDCVDWDSETEDNAEEKPVNVVNKRQRVDTLAALALKAVVSQRFLGKVPKKYRKIRVNKMFDSLGGFGVKNVDRLLERLEDDVDNSVGQKENSASDVKNQDNAIDKSGNASDDAKNVSDCMREERSSKDITDNDRSSSGTKNVKHCSNGGDESSHKMNINNEEGSENIKSSNSKVDINEESDKKIIENSNTLVQDSAESNESTDCPVNNVVDAITNNSKEDSNICKDKEHKENSNNIDETADSVMTEDTAVEINGQNNENKTVEETSSNADSRHEVLERKNGISNESFALNNVINTDVEDKNLMDALDEQIGENNDMVENARTLNSPEKCKDIPKETFDQSNEFGANIGDEKLDRTANGGRAQKLTFEDLFENKDMDHDSPYLDTISDEEYNFDV